MNSKDIVATRAVHFEIGRNQFIRGKSSENFVLHLGRCKRKSLSFRAEAIRAARGIRRRTKKPIAVCYSGGLDSELALSAFRAAGIPVLCAVLKYENRLNQHDISYALRFCRANRQEFKLIHFDVKEFLLGQEYHKLLRQLNNPHPIAPSNFFLYSRLLEMGFYPVSGCGEPCVTLAGGRFFLEDGEINFALEQYCRIKDIDAEPSFFRSSPELYLSMLKWFNRKTSDFARNFDIRTDRDLNIPYKTALYHEAFGLSARPKFHGYEKLLQQFPETTRLLIRKRHPAKKIHRLELGRAIRVLQGRAN